MNCEPEGGAYWRPADGSPVRTPSTFGHMVMTRIGTTLLMLALLAGCNSRDARPPLPLAYTATELQVIGIVSNYCTHNCEKFDISRYVDGRMIVTGRAKKFNHHFGLDLDQHLSQFGWQALWYPIDYRHDRDFWIGFGQKTEKEDRTSKSTVRAAARP